MFAWYAKHRCLMLLAFFGLSLTCMVPTGEPDGWEKKDINDLAIPSLLQYLWK